MVRTIDDGSYFSVPAMESRRRRLFTFTNPLLLSHDGSIVATAAEGMDDGERDDAGMRFLVLDALWDGMIMKRLQLDGLDAVIGVWVNPSVIASEQVKAPSLLPARSIRDVAPRKRIVTGIPDTDIDEHGNERTVPVGTVGEVDPLDAASGLHTIRWANGAVTRWTPQEIADDATEVGNTDGSEQVRDLSAADRIEAQRLLVQVAEDARDLISCNCSYDAGSERRCDGTCTQGMATRALTLLGRVPR